MGISLSVRPVERQRRQLAVRFYSKWYYVRSGSMYKLGESCWPWTDFIPSRPKFSDKRFSYFIFSKSSNETFCCSKDKFRGHLIYSGGWRQRISKSLIGRTECETETRRTVNQMLILSIFICICSVVTIEYCD